MTVEDFSFGLDENNTEYVEFIENPTKTRQSRLSAKPRSFLPKMFAIGDDRCPVAIFKEFLWRRPPEIRTTGRLYLSCVPNPSSQVWYKRQPMGANKINDMMKSVIKGTSLEDSLKTFSNHSARKTVVKKLKTAGLERSSIVKVTGHRNEKSLDDYDEGDEREQRELSHTISHAKNINSQLAEETALIVAPAAPAIFLTRSRQTLKRLNVETTLTKQLSRRFRCQVLSLARMISVSVS